MQIKSSSTGSEAEPALPEQGATVLSACGGQMRFESDTPWAIYRGRRLYFCLPSCKEAFENDPETSCLVGD